MFVVMFVIGFVVILSQISVIGGVFVVFYYVWYVCYEMIIGFIVYIIVLEVFFICLCLKIIGLVCNVYNCFNIVVICMVFYIFNFIVVNWKGKFVFLVVGFCVFCVVWVWFCLFEFKDWIYEEFDILFIKNLGVCEFEKYEFSYDIEVEVKLGVEYKE